MRQFGDRLRKARSSNNAAAPTALHRARLPPSVAAYVTAPRWRGGIVGDDVMVPHCCVRWGTRDPQFETTIEGALRRVLDRPARA